MKISLFLSLIFCSLACLSQEELDTTHLEFFYPKSYFTFENKKENIKNGIKAELKPHLRLSPGYSSSNNFGYSSFGGVNIDLEKRNLRIQVSPYAGGAALPEYMNSFVDSTGVFSSMGLAKKEGSFYYAANAEGRLNWQVSKHFNAEIGRGRNFWGNGYRSMVLGNSAAPYPYLKLTTKAWKFRYVNLFMKHRSLEGNTSDPSFRNKFASFHAIDLDITEDITFTVFESVIWQAKDTLSNRGFDLNYLNPVIFYRPVEFSQGSADNVLLGIGMRYAYEQKHLFYFQLFLDEFFLENVVAANGWWANKIGMQMGVKSKLKPTLLAYTEFNFARPFTYTHGSTLQNYGHLNQSLAHPLGTNFMESTSGVEFKKDNLIVNLRLNWALYGRDRDGDNYGGDVFRSFKSPFRNFMNYIGQGNTHHSYIVQTSVSKKIQHKIWLTFSYNWRHVKSSFSTKNEHIANLGISLSPHKLLSRDLKENHFNFSNDM